MDFLEREEKYIRFTSPFSIILLVAGNTITRRLLQRVLEEAVVEEDGQANRREGKVVSFVYAVKEESVEVHEERQADVDERAEIPQLYSSEEHQRVARQSNGAKGPHRRRDASSSSADDWQDLPENRETGRNSQE